MSTRNRLTMLQIAAEVAINPHHLRYLRLARTRPAAAVSANFSQIPPKCRNLAKILQTSLGALPRLWHKFSA